MSTSIMSPFLNDNSPGAAPVTSNRARTRVGRTLMPSVIGDAVGEMGDPAGENALL